MSNSTNNSETEGQYLLDVENAAEMARLTKLGRIAMELVGLFPEPLTLRPGARLLDIGCGPGEWVRDAAQSLPESLVTGIDISHLMVDYARSCAQAENLPNASFQVMDAVRQPLAFADATFDFIHLGGAMSFLSPTGWPKLLQECYRVLSPGGILCSIEAESMGVIITPALARYNVLLMQVVRQTGHSFAPEGEAGITAMQRRLLAQAGLTQIKGQAAVLDYSAEAPAHATWCEAYRSMLKLSEPALLRSGLITAPELQLLSEQALEEMRRDDFCAVVFFQSVWGQKPGAH